MLLEHEITEAMIGAAMDVHRELGPGLLESAYEECFCHELHLRGLSFQRQVELPVAYKGLKLDCGYRLDVVVENSVVVELKSIGADLTDSPSAGTYIFAPVRKRWVCSSISILPCQRTELCAECSKP